MPKRDHLSDGRQEARQVQKHRRERAGQLRLRGKHRQSGSAIAEGMLRMRLGKLKHTLHPIAGIRRTCCSLTPLVFPIVGFCIIGGADPPGPRGTPSSRSFLEKSGTCDHQGAGQGAGRGPGGPPHQKTSGVVL